MAVDTVDTVEQLVLPDWQVEFERPPEIVKPEEFVVPRPLLLPLVY